jgi:hypothetical protein
LHLNSYIERWHLHGDNSDNFTNPHWFNLKHSLKNGALKEAIMACFMVLPLHGIGDVKDVLENIWLDFDFISPQFSDF